VKEIVDFHCVNHWHIKFKGLPEGNPGDTMSEYPPLCYRSGEPANVSERGPEILLSRT
jgi:hypothetical protein